MFKFLLIMFAFIPNEGVGTLKKPFASLEECQAAATSLVKKATTDNIPVVGTCISPKDYVGT